METKTQTEYWLPRIQTTLIEEINRRAAATGSVTFAMQTAHADYNGHCIRVWYNDYKGYWIAEYHWGERVVLTRGSAMDCLRAGADYYKRGAKGSAVVTSGPMTEEEVKYAESLGFVTHNAEIEKQHISDDPRKALISEAFMYEKQLGVPAVSILANATSVEDYKAKVDAIFQSRKRGAA